MKIFIWIVTLLPLCKSIYHSIECFICFNLMKNIRGRMYWGFWYLLRIWSLYLIMTSGARVRFKFWKQFSASNFITRKRLAVEIWDLCKKFRKTIFSLFKNHSKIEVEAQVSHFFLIETPHFYDRPFTRNSFPTPNNCARNWSGPDTSKRNQKEIRFVQNNEFPSHATSSIFNSKKILKNENIPLLTFSSWALNKAFLVSRSLLFISFTSRTRQFFSLCRVSTWKKFWALRIKHINIWKKIFFLVA